MKKAAALLFAILIVLSATGCTQGRASEPVDITKAASELQKKVPVDDMLSKVETETALALYGLSSDDIVKIEAYTSTGATAEEIVLVEAAQGKVERCKEALAQRIADQKDGFRDYAPAELPKLEQACLAAKDNVVILCVSKDAQTAKKVVTEILGE